MLTQEADEQVGGRNINTASRVSIPEGNFSEIRVVASGNELTLTGPGWSLRWAPPEVVNGNHPGLPSDIWSVGWVCWEVGSVRIHGLTSH